MKDVKKIVKKKINKEKYYDAFWYTRIVYNIVGKLLNNILITSCITQEVYYLMKLTIYI